jgi:hypothetical protein
MPPKIDHGHGVDAPRALLDRTDFASPWVLTSLNICSAFTSGKIGSVSPGGEMPATDENYP